MYIHLKVVLYCKSIYILYTIIYYIESHCVTGTYTVHYIILSLTVLLVHILYTILY